MYPYPPQRRRACGFRIPPFCKSKNHRLENTFYYGSFEYPRESGIWYKGKHKPIITKELFDLVQEQVKNSQLVRKENIEFAFTKIMKCGLCGSGVSATEKFKKQKNGPPKRHVYYGCTKARDKNCKCGYISETELIDQLQNLADKLDLKKTPMQNKIKAEIRRFKKFQGMVTGKSDSIEVSDVDVQNYAKFLLKEGDDREKRDLLSCLNGELFLSGKTIALHSKSTIYPRKLPERENYRKESKHDENDCSAGREIKIKRDKDS
ncbi:hypothetical protein EBR66_01005 [bacterium]|nr:hypothetical protein [bacterium]